MHYIHVLLFSCMKRISKLFFLVNIFSFIALNNVFAYDFTDKIYGKANISIGYNLQKYTGSYFKQIMHNKGISTEERKVNKYNHAITISLGYNLYFKINNYFHPFVGLEAISNLPLTGNTINSYLGQNRHGEIFRTTLKFKEYFILHGKFGTKINIYNNFVIAPYLIAGINRARYKTARNYQSLYKQIKTGFSTGIGIETFMTNNFSVSLECRITRNKFILANGYKAIGYTHNITAKIGYYFL